MQSHKKRLDQGLFPSSCHQDRSVSDIDLEKDRGVHEEHRCSSTASPRKEVFGSLKAAKSRAYQGHLAITIF